MIARSTSSSPSAGSSDAPDAVRYNRFAMPTYEYRCQDCGHIVEVVQSFTDEPLTVCEVCGGRLRRVFHPVGIVLKGSGFYSTDNRPGKKTTPAKPKETTKSDSGSSSSESGSGSSSSDSGSGSSSSDSGSRSGSSDSSKKSEPKKTGDSKPSKAS